MRRQCSQSSVPISSIRRLPGPPPPTLFLEVCETKGFADAFLRKCVNLKRLCVIALQFVIFRPLGTFAKTVQDNQVLNLGSTVRGQPWGISRRHVWQDRSN